MGSSSLPKLMLATLILALQMAAQAPPMYNGVNTTTATVALTNPGFSPSTTYNTVVYSPLNPTSNPDSVLTDSKWTCGKGLTASSLSVSNLTSSMAAGDIMSSVPLPDGSVNIAVHVSGDNCFLHIHFDPITGAAQNGTNGTGESSCASVGGMFGFSKANPYQFYWYDMHQLHQGTFTNDCTFVETKNSQFPFDYTTCAGVGVPAGTIAKSGSILGISAQDRIISVNLSWTGIQGTSSTVMAYQPGVGCSVLNLLTGNAYDYTGKLVGTETTCLDPNAAAGQGVHDTDISNDGRIAVIAGGAWKAYGSGNICWWEVGTTNVQASNVTSGLHISGHNTTAGRSILFLDPPNPNIRTMYPLTAANLSSFQILAKIPNIGAMTQMHGAQAHPYFSDYTPWIIESAGNSPDPLHPLAYVNEVIGITTFFISPPLRFGTTWNIPPAGQISGCTSGIGFIDQTGQHWFYLSNGLQSFGNDSNGKPLCLLMSKTL